MKITTLLLVASCMLLASCVTARVDTDTDRVDTVTTTRVETRDAEVWGGLATAYAAANGVKPFDGTILRVDVIPIANQPGELLRLELWPLFELGIGFVGARVHVLPIEVGAGVLFYWPRPIDYWDLYTVHDRTVIERRDTVIERRDTEPDVDVRVRTTP